MRDYIEICESIVGSIIGLLIAHFGFQFMLTIFYKIVVNKLERED